MRAAIRAYQPYASPPMKHASRDTLEALQPLLDELRRVPDLVERTPGAFYFKSKAFLHFHEDPTGLHADVKLDFVRFERLRVATREEQRRLLAEVKRCLARPSSAGR